MTSEEHHNQGPHLRPDWDEAIDRGIRESRVFCMGLFSPTGEVQFVNPALAGLLGTIPAESFVNPTFERIVGLNVPECVQEPVFSGFVTLTKDNNDTSILARIYRSDEQILILGEIDVTTLSRQYLTVVELNRENSRLRRDLIQQKHTLQREVEQRKESEVRVRKLLEEKEVILKEVHHRIKNNMNTVVSVLRLQDQRHDHGPTKSILQDAAQRVNSMMLLYDKLYQSSSSSFDEMELDLYLTPLIRQVLGVFPRGASIQVRTEIEPIRMRAKTLSELGIIVNELVTNAMKYAFADRDGILTVAAHRTGRNVTLIVADNGPGLPERPADGTPPGFGMTLVDALMQQLDGTLRSGNDHGARFVLEFEIPD